MFASKSPIKIAYILINCGWLLYGIRDNFRLSVLMHDLLTHLGLDRQDLDHRWLEVYKLTG